MLQESIRYKIGTLNSGIRRIYIPNSEALNNANFLSNTRYQLEVKGKNLILTPSKSGTNKVVNTTRGENVIELRNKMVSNFLGKDTQYITATIKPNMITITLHHQEKRRIERENHFLKNLIRKTLNSGSLYAGIGMLTLRIHKGLEDAGIKPVMKFANEIDPIAAKINANHNPIWHSRHKDSLFLQDSIETCDPALLPNGIDHLDIGQVCTPYSKITPVSLRDMNHKSDGCLFISTIKAIATINPATLTLECTPAFKNSAGYKGITHALKISGYEYQVIELSGSDYADFEVRKRLCLFAYSSGLKDLFPSIESVEKFKAKNKKTLSDIKENIAQDSVLWKTYEHIRKRDNMNNLGYKNILIKDDATSMPALVATYSSPKAGVPFIPHDSDASKQRQITVLEHCRIRGLPDKLTNTLLDLANGKLLKSNRTNVKAAHRCLGNGPSPSPWSIMSFVMFSNALTTLKKQNHLPLYLA